MERKSPYVKGTTNVKRESIESHANSSIYSIKASIEAQVQVAADTH